MQTKNVRASRLDAPSAGRRQRAAKPVTRRGARATMLANAYFLIDKRWRVVAFDDGATQWFGVPRGKLLGRELWDLAPDDRGTEFEIEIRRAVAERAIVHFEFHSRFSRRMIAVSALPTRNAVSILLRDVAPGGRAEFGIASTGARLSEILVERNEDLAATRRLHEVGQVCGQKDADPTLCLRMILDTAIALTRADMGNVQLVEPKTGDLRLAVHVGFDAPFLTFFALVRAGDFSGCAAAARIRQRIVVQDVAQSPIFAGRPSLGVLQDAGVCAVQSTPLLSGAGRLSGVISTHYTRPYAPSPRELGWMDLLARQAADYLDRIEAERELRSLNDELRMTDRRKDEFLATLSHELRNPLAPIRNASRVLTLTSNEGAELAWCRDVIDRQTTQLMRLLDDLLDISRIGHGKIELRRERVEIGETFESAVETVRPLLGQQPRNLEVAIPSPLAVDGDAARLAQVFGNLLNNAIKYTNAGGKISAGAARDGEQIVVTVGDDGIGMTPETLARIFGMFQQADAARPRAHGGLGIGLALARGLVALHGGTLEARSEGSGRGSTFTVRLPAAPEAEAGRLISPPQSATKGVIRRILVVDDLPDAADSLALWLRRLGHQVRTAYDGAEALDLAAAFRPELVLLDLAMPRMSGYQVCRRLRASLAGQSIRVVALTGFGQKRDQERAMAAGFDQHLVKPVGDGDLEALLASLRGG